MIEDKRNITLCYVLILQLVILSVSATMPALYPQEFLRIWHTLKITFLPKAIKKAGIRKNKFWEIDMTKFEP